MKLKGYVSVRDPVPVAVQNMVLRAYCDRGGHVYSLADVEFVMPGFPMLEGIVEYAERFDGIVAYSMWQMPPSAARERFLSMLSGMELHFALEGYVLPRDRETCDAIWALKEVTR